MSYCASIVITNDSKEIKKVILEPWADEFELPPEKSFEFIAKAEIEGRFEVNFDEQFITIFAWETSTVNVYCDGQEIGAGNFQRQSVPDIPKGQAVSSFMKNLFGKSE